MCTLFASGQRTDTKDRVSSHGQFILRLGHVVGLGDDGDDDVVVSQRARDGGIDEAFVLVAHLPRLFTPIDTAVTATGSQGQGGSGGSLGRTKCNSYRNET